MVDKKTIEWEIRLRDLASKILKELGTNAKKEAKKADTAFGKLGKSLGGIVGSFAKIATGVGVAAVAFKAFTAVTSRLSKGVQDAIEFSRAMAEVSTISEDVAQRLGFVTDQVLDLSTKFGLLETDAATALYQTISAGVTDTTQAMELLDAAVTLSRGGLADLTSTIDLLTNSINAYGMGVEDVEHINNVFFETVRLGKTTITNLADSMGVAMPIAANLGVSIEELSAMLAALTKGGVDTTTAVIYVRQALNSILRPSADAQKLMERLNISFDAGKVKADGFIGILNELKVKLGDNIDEWQKFFPNVRAFIPVLALAGNQFEEFQTILGRLTSTALDDAQPAMRALERVMLSAGDKIQNLSNAMRQGFMELGLGIIEGVTGPIDSIEELQGASLSIRDAIGGLVPVVQLVAGAMLQMVSLIPTMIALFASLAEKSGAVFSDEQRASLRLAEEGMKDVADMASELGRAMRNGGEGVSEALANIAKRQSEARQTIVSDVAAISQEYEALKGLLETEIEFGVVGAGFGGIADIGKTFAEVLRGVEVPEEYGDDLMKSLMAPFDEKAFQDEARKVAPRLRSLLGSELYAEALDVDMRALQPVIDSLPGKLLPGIRVAFNLAARRGEGNLAGAMEYLSDEALVALVKGLGRIEEEYKDRVADFAVKTGRSWQNVRDEVLATMRPEQFAGAVAASVQSMTDEFAPAFSILDRVVVDAAKGVYPAAQTSLREAFDQLGGDGVTWAKQTYLQLQKELDSATKSAFLGPDALRILQANVRKAQNELLKLGGPELRKQLEDDINRTLGMGAVGSGESEAAAERAARIDEANFLIREQGLLLEQLKYRSEDTATAQIAAIKATTEVTRQELRLRLESNDEATKITKEEYESLYAALEEGERRQIDLVREKEAEQVRAARDARVKELKEFNKREDAMRRFAEKVAGIYTSAMTKAGQFVTGLFVENMEDIGNNLGAALSDAVGGALGQLESFVTVTPEMALESLVQQVKDAETQLSQIKAINLAAILVGEDPIFSPEQLQSLQDGIDNVKEYELAAIEAQVAHSNFLGTIQETPEQIQSSLEGPLGELQGYVTEVPGQALQNLQTLIANAEAQVEMMRTAQLSPEAGGGAMFTQQQIAAAEAMIANVKNHALVTEEARQKVEAYRESFEKLPEGIQGAGLAIGEFIQENLDLKAVMQDFMSNFLDGFAGLLTQTFTAIATGAKSASEAWSDFGRMFVTMIVQMAVQMAVMLTLAAALKVIAPGLAEFMFGASALGAVGLKDGGIVQGGTGEMHALANGGVVLGGLGRATPVRGYANGGPIVSGPHVALIGEGRHNEAVVPLPDGRSIPVEMRGDSQASQANVSINISAVDSRGIDELLVERSSTLKDIIRQALSEDRIFRNQVSLVR